MKSQYMVYHILVKHEYEAQDVLKKIDQGLSFEAAAKKFSSCSSASQGGLLGPFKSGRFVEAFEEGLESVGLNAVSKPIRTSFGYHLILKKPI